VQRLFSTFPNGLPGLGLLLQRLIAGTVLVDYAIVHLRALTDPATLAPQLIALGAGILLIAGLWTPLVGLLVAIVEFWAFVPGPADPWVPLLLATLGASLALIGPGAWSIDARLFGRKQISVPSRQGIADSD